MVRMTIDTDGFKPNLESHLAPILATQLKAELNSKGGQQRRLLPSPLTSSCCRTIDTDGFKPNLESHLAPILATQLKAELNSKGGQQRRLLPSPLTSSCCRSEQGAGSPALFETMKRIGGCCRAAAPKRASWDAPSAAPLLCRRTWRTLHPNYAERHEEQHQPRLHRGLVVKFNANQRYATNMVLSYLFREIAKRNGILTQSFVVLNDLGCGSNIGPILASGVGMPQEVSKLCKFYCSMCLVKATSLTILQDLKVAGQMQDKC
eukprot:jgi/Mesen1/3008/ME000177S02278